MRCIERLIIFVAENKRKFLEEYASEKGFNPLIAQNWYKQSRESIMAMNVRFFFPFYIFIIFRF